MDNKEIRLGLIKINKFLRTNCVKKQPVLKLLMSVQTVYQVTTIYNVS